MKKMLQKLLTVTLICGILSGCGTVQSLTGWGKPSSTEKVIEAVSNSHESLTVLSAVGGICLLTGMGLLVLSKGTRGWRPVIGGVLLVVLNFVISEYANWIFVPMLIATGCISAAWGWHIICGIYKEKKNGRNI